MTDTASSVRWRASIAENRAMISAAGSPARLPATSDHVCLPSRTAASDSTDRGSGCFPGVVDSGLNKRIIGPPRHQTLLARAAAVAATSDDEAATAEDRAMGRTGRASRDRLPADRDR